MNERRIAIQGNSETTLSPKNGDIITTLLVIFLAPPSLCGGFIPSLALPAPAAAGLKRGLKETGVIMIKLTLSLWMGAKVVNGSVVSGSFFFFLTHQ